MLLNDMNKHDLLTAMKLVLNLIEKVGEMLHGQDSMEVTQAMLRTKDTIPKSMTSPKVKPSSTISSPTEMNSMFRKRKNPLPSKYGPHTAFHMKSGGFQKPSSSIMSKYKMLTCRLGQDGSQSDCGGEDLSVSHDDTQVPDSRSQGDNGGQKEETGADPCPQEDAIDYRTTDDKSQKMEENLSPQANNDAHNDSFSDHTGVDSPVEHPDSPSPVEYSSYSMPAESTKPNDQPVFPSKVYLQTQSPGPEYPPVQDLNACVTVSMVPHTTSGFPHSIDSITGALGIRPSTYPYSQNSFVPLPKIDQHLSGNSSSVVYDGYYEMPKPLAPLKHDYQEDGRVHYKCGFCKKVIAYSELFHKHLKSHVTKTANKCDLCNITFAFRSNLFRHIRRYHIEYVCAMCNAVCPRPKQLEQHLHVHHSEMNAVVKEVSLR